MFWQENDAQENLQVPDDVVDVLFSIRCKRLPVDHAYALSAALSGAIPWITQDPTIGIHSVHVAGSQNGWERPEHGTDQHLILSRRSKLTIRVPRERIDQLVEELPDRSLNIDGCPLTVGQGKIRRLSKETTLFSRYIAARPGDSEEQFLGRIAQELADMGIPLRKALCGKRYALANPGGPLSTRSLMIADLSPENSIRLQQTGLGPHRLMGCGIFIPHKGIEAVKSDT